MTAIHSALDTRSDEFRANAERLRSLVEDLRDKTAHAARGGSDDARRKHLERGKLLVRERINALVDPGSAVLELSPLAAFTSGGPPRKMVPVPETMIVSSDIAGT